MLGDGPKREDSLHYLQRDQGPPDFGVRGYFTKASSGPASWGRPLSAPAVARSVLVATTVFVGTVRAVVISAGPLAEILPERGTDLLGTAYLLARWVPDRKRQIGTVHSPALQPPCHWRQTSRPECSRPLSAAEHSVSGRSVTPKDYRCPPKPHGRKSHLWLSLCHRKPIWEFRGGGQRLLSSFLCFSGSPTHVSRTLG